MVTVIGGNGGETMEGAGTRDKLYGEGGNDRIFGNGGNDKLIGGAGKDFLDGGEGNDTLVGDASGGSFKDIFHFGENSGKDVITDFQVGKDMLEIQKGLNGIKKPEDVLDHAKQDGKHVVINLGDGNKITLKFVDLDDLKKNPGDHFDIVNN
jgi:Ca2+-binding RTX toxin-like protein